MSCLTVTSGERRGRHLSANLEESIISRGNNAGNGGGPTQVGSAAGICHKGDRQEEGGGKRGTDDEEAGGTDPGNRGAFERAEEESRECEDPARDNDRPTVTVMR